MATGYGVSSKLHASKRVVLKRPKVVFAYRLSTLRTLLGRSGSQSDPGGEPEEVRSGNLLGPRYSKGAHYEAKLFFTKRRKTLPSDKTIKLQILSTRCFVTSAGALRGA